MNDMVSTKALTFIAACRDPKKLRQIATNAATAGNIEVERAASLRLYEVLPAEEPGTFEHDVWQSIHALEHSLTTERGRTTLLARTRQKIKKVGEQQTVSDLLLSGKPSEGFRMLLDRAMPERTFEAVALRHPEKFGEEELTVAKERLADAGLDPTGRPQKL